MTVTVGSGEYRYELQENWAQLPDGWVFTQVAAVAVDADDIVLVRANPRPQDTTGEGAPQRVLIWSRAAFLANRPGVDFVAAADNAVITSSRVYLRIGRG